MKMVFLVNLFDRASLLRLKFVLKYVSNVVEDGNGRDKGLRWQW